MVQMIVYNIKETACVSLLAILSQPTRCYGLVVRISAFDSDGPGSNPGGTSLFFLFFFGEGVYSSLLFIARLRLILVVSLIYQYFCNC